MNVSRYGAAARENPVAVALELGSLATCVLLLFGLVIAIASGPPVGRGGLWLAVIVVGAGFVCSLTLVWPLFDRLRDRRGRRPRIDDSEQPRCHGVAVDECDHQAEEDRHQERRSG